MASPFLNITPVAAGQNNKEVTINDADLALERATQDILTVDLTMGNAALTAAQFTRHMVFRCIGLTLSRQLMIPHNVGSGAGTAKRVFSVIHDTDADTDLTLTTGQAGGSNIVLKKGMRAMISSDGTNLRLITVAGGESGVSIGVFVPGGIPDATLMLRYLSAINFILPAGLVGSYGSAVTGPEGGNVVFDLRLNGASFGSMTFEDGETIATFSLASPRNVVPGDILTVVSPPELHDLTDLSFTLLGL
jgi:hypothetical protein